MPTRIGINGFGRIGRGFLRAAVERDSDLEIVAINDIADPQTLAHLLKFDSVYGRFPEHVAAGDQMIEAGRHKITATAHRDPLELPWEELGVDVVIEATGRFRTREQATQHLTRGAKKVILSAPDEGLRARRREHRARRQRRRLRPRAPPHRHQRLVHDELPGAGVPRCCTRRSASATA